MKRFGVVSLIVLLCAVFISGCLTVREIKSGTQWDNNAMFLLDRGKTTAKDIAYSFGSPQKEIDGGKNGRIWVYFYDTGTYIFEGAINHGLAEGEHNALTLWFNGAGILSDFSYSYNKIEDPTKKKMADNIRKNEQMTGGPTQ